MRHQLHFSITISHYYNQYVQYAQRWELRHSSSHGADNRWAGRHDFAIRCLSEDLHVAQPELTNGDILDGYDAEDAADERHVAVDGLRVAHDEARIHVVAHGVLLKPVSHADVGHAEADADSQREAVSWKLQHTDVN